MEIRVDLERIKRDILTLAKIGRRESDRGIYRMAFTDADIQGKRWLTQQIEQADLIASTDGAMNISGELSGTTDAPRVLVGSHIDTVPCAGALDGTLGVVVGLECLRTLRETGFQPDRTLELIAFSDEEGRFGGMFGSQAVCGQLNPQSLETTTDMNGVLLRDELGRHGHDALSALDAARVPESIAAYIELHIEQGPVLDRTKKAVGVVDEITGLFTWAVTLRGEANHAGTTPMEMRNDAFMGLADFAHEIPRILEENGSDRSRTTIGKAQILPGATNTVPGLVEFSLDVRDTSEAVLEELGTAFRKALSAIARRRNLMFEFAQKSYLRPVACHDAIVQLLMDQASKLELDHLRMPSGAAHDAQIMGSMVPVGMIFVPSKNGQSHSPAEWTAWSDIEAGANLMLQTLVQLSSATN
ncbi:N-carbamoyl-L-amino acid hydrolase [Rosistilla oblonga]|uniref:N-carbamoyl-L-amino acid hydrolase n=2 Tax=Rosistilla TaxID=2795779 RepID=A0A518ISA9_9BACT|nr:Zn-dependent hydrolase [Rosistilla oblonga]QDS87560.1 N-carbamoyl-L-amino acid hydrolase [Rosistilla ulvae]QDV12010.1 N-carbamoyl-L-amino acid hydrolase [Rosistilla oblonga]QDV55960.1 N-carbamoyl-L-amino acid hydrolase [Rosistilla oblonga]